MHVFPMVAYIARALREGGQAHPALGRAHQALDYLGSLDSLSTEWPRIMRRALNRTDTFRSLGKGGGHLITSDPTLPDRAAMRRFLHTNSSLLTALCLVLLPDFKCLNYSVPPQCAVNAATMARAVDGLQCGHLRLPVPRVQ